MLHHIELLLEIYLAQYWLVILTAAAVGVAAGFIFWARSLRRRFAIFESSEEFEGMSFQLERIANALELLSTSEERIEGLFSSPLMQQPPGRPHTTH